jgi:hypothetical protein
VPPLPPKGTISITQADVSSQPQQAFILGPQDSNAQFGTASLGSMPNLQPSDFLGGGAAGATGAATGGIVPVTQTQVQGGVSLDDQSSNTVHSVLKPPGS